MRPLGAINNLDRRISQYVKFTLYDGDVVILKSGIGETLQPKIGSSVWNPNYSDILNPSIAS